MRDQNYRTKASASDDPDNDLNRVLNTALATYATVEAREGLEQRILANLRSQDSRSLSRLWAWGLVTAALAIVMLAVAWRFGGNSRPTVADHPATPQAPVAYVAPQKTDNTIIRNIAPVRKHVAPRTAPSELNPKLDQFPSPQAMSQQEKLLAMYINQDPNHAALIAEARMEAIRQDEEEKMNLVSADDRGVGR